MDLQYPSVKSKTHSDWDDKFIRQCRTQQSTTKTLSIASPPTRGHTPRSCPTLVPRSQSHPEKPWHVFSALVLTSDFEVTPNWTKLKSIKPIFFPTSLFLIFHQGAGGTVLERLSFKQSIRSTHYPTEPKSIQKHLRKHQRRTVNIKSRAVGQNVCWPIQCVNNKVFHSYLELMWWMTIVLINTTILRITCKTPSEHPVPIDPPESPLLPHIQAHALAILPRTKQQEESSGFDMFPCVCGCWANCEQTRPLIIWDSVSTTKVSIKLAFHDTTTITESSITKMPGHCPKQWFHMIPTY